MVIGLIELKGEWLEHQGTQAISAAFEGAGHQIFLVGGCVRDALLGRVVYDIDMATTALPDVAMNIARTAGFKVIPTAPDHGTIVVVADGRAHEITTFRQDVVTDGRHAQVAFTCDMISDARRRDFTMNALYADARGRVVDPLGGLPDALARRVHFVGNAQERITEDYLRILRFFRFHACYADKAEGVNPEGLAACALYAWGVETLSYERIGAEMRKMLGACDTLWVVQAMAQSGVLEYVLPNAKLERFNRFEKIARVFDVMPDAVQRLAALGGRNVKERLRLSQAEAKRLMGIEKALLSFRSAAEFGYRLGYHDGVGAFLLRLVSDDAENESEGLAKPDDLARIYAGAHAVFPVKSADLAPLEGVDLGQKLRLLETRWIASGFTLTKKELLE